MEMKKRVNNIKKAKKKGNVRNKRKKEVGQIIDGFYDFLCNLDIQEKIKKARTGLDIPLSGFHPTRENNDNFKYGNYEPSQWKYRYFKEWSYLYIDLGLKTLLNKFGQDSEGLKRVFRVYFFHNHIDFDLLSETANRENMASVVDNEEELEEYGHDSKVFMGYCTEKFRNYPLAIRLSPYASKEQLKSFIKNNWTTIKKIQDKYKISNIKLGKLRIRKDKTNEIRLFIAENYNKKGYDLQDDILAKSGIYMTLPQINTWKNRIKENK